MSKVNARTVTLNGELPGPDLALHCSIFEIHIWEPDMGRKYDLISRTLRGVGSMSPLPAHRLHRLTGRRGGQGGLNPQRLFNF